MAINTLWNLIGQVAPLIMAVVSVPILIRHIGTDRFGVLSLAWLLIGYFGLFDLGLGRALTKVVADKLRSGDQQEMPSLIWTALALVAALGAAGAGVMALLVPSLIRSVLKIPLQQQSEVIGAFYCLAVSLPIVTMTSGLRGVLEAHQKFFWLTAIRVPMAMFNYAAPLLLLPFTQNMQALVAVLVLGRALAWFAHLELCFRTIPDLRRRIALERSAVIPVLNMGAWLTVSNVVGPLMVYLDRFVLGALISMSAVAYYTAPSEIVGRLTILPQALVGVLFPAFAMSVGGNALRAQRLLRKSTKYIFMTTFPPVLLLVLFAPELLQIWLGEEFAQHSAGVLQWLAAGIFINCLSYVPVTFVQGAGRPDLTAKVHLVELPFYLLLLYWSTKFYGLTGVAIAWTARAFADAVLMSICGHRLMALDARTVRTGVLSFAASMFVVVASALIPHTVAKFAFVVIFSLVFLLAAWKRGLDGEEKRAVLRLVTAKAY